MGPGPAPGAGCLCRAMCCRVVGGRLHRCRWASAVPAAAASAPDPTCSVLFTPSVTGSVCQNRLKRSRRALRRGGQPGRPGFDDAARRNAWAKTAAQDSRPRARRLCAEGPAACGPGSASKEPHVITFFAASIPAILKKSALSLTGTCMCRGGNEGGTCLWCPGPHGGPQPHPASPAGARDEI
jgi:hypothetical protein